MDQDLQTFKKTKSRNRHLSYIELNKYTRMYEQLVVMITLFPKHLSSFERP